MRRNSKGESRQTAGEYAAELRRWGRYSEEHIRKAVEYALAKGTILPDDAAASATSDEKLAPD